jgi:hypothetical protein
VVVRAVECLHEQTSAAEAAVLLQGYGSAKAEPFQGNRSFGVFCADCEALARKLYGPAKAGRFQT